jgi:single-strand DNA-binding protein
MNHVSLVGNLTRDPAYFDAPQGKIAKFDIATKVGYDPEKKEDRVEFVPVTAFGISERFQEYLKKGRMVSVNGRVSTDSYEKEGQKMYATTVKVSNGSLRLLGPAPKAEAAADAQEIETPAE